MIVIDWPATLSAGDGSGFGQLRNDLVSPNDVVGGEQVRLLGPPRWGLSIVQPQVLPQRLAGQWQAVMLRLRGRVNLLYAWDFGRPYPIGTLRGAYALSATPAAGADTISFAPGAGMAGKTLLAGDWIQIGTGALGNNQLVKVVADYAVSGGGSISPTFEPPLRKGFVSGSPVILSRAKSHFRAASERSVWSSAQSMHVVSGMTLDLVEYFQ